MEEHIYVLRCPETRAVRWVGVTHQRLANRLRGHILDAQRGPRRGRVHPKDEWIAGLLARGLTPEIEAVDTWDRRSVSEDDYELRTEREGRWILRYVAEGASLLNVVRNPQAAEHRRAVRAAANLAWRARKAALGIRWDEPIGDLNSREARALAVLGDTFAALGSALARPA